MAPDTARPEPTSPAARAASAGPGRDLREADLRGRDLRGADLRGADLRYAVLLGAQMLGADLTGADLTGADLTYAILTRVRPVATASCRVRRCGATKGAGNLRQTQEPGDCCSVD
jgi:hypothetical protein